MNFIENIEDLRKHRKEEAIETSSNMRHITSLRRGQKGSDILPKVVIRVKNSISEASLSPRVRMSVSQEDMLLTPTVNNANESMKNKMSYFASDLSIYDEKTPKP